jgi:hypothetical protein
MALAGFPTKGNLFCSRRSYIICNISYLILRSAYICMWKGMIEVFIDLVGGPVLTTENRRLPTYVVAFRCQPDAGRYKRTRVLYHLHVGKWD